MIKKEEVFIVKKRYCFLAIIPLLSILLSSCYLAYLTPWEKEYYAHRENYVTATGTITFIKYNEEQSALYFSFSDLTPGFPDHMFKIVGENLLTAQENGIDEKIYVGKQVEFVSAPKYFGDGYIMPIIAITVDDEVLLPFNEGFENFQKWLKVN